MSIFKKSKSKEFLESLKKESCVVINPDVPEVIKESKIKPTKCNRCLSIYQAKHKHIISELDYTKINSFVLLTSCPICHCKNFVEFEEAEE